MTEIMRNSSSTEETLKSLFREAKVYILQAAGDCTHRFGPPNYLDKSSKIVKTSWGSPHSGTEQCFVEPKRS